MNKATFIKTYIFQGKKYGLYQYRGREYSVLFEWNAEPLQWQHKSEQDLINNILDNTNKATENAQTGLDLFFDITK